MPFRKGTIFPCMFTFAHAGHGNRAPGDKFELQEAARGPPNIHTYIQTNKLTTRQFGFCTGFYTNSKLEFHVCLPMPAEEIVHTFQNSWIWAFPFPRPGPRFFTKPSKNVKKVNDSFRVCMYVCLVIFPRPAWPKRPIHTYIHTHTDIYNSSITLFFRVCLKCVLVFAVKTVPGSNRIKKKHRAAFKTHTFCET